MADGGEVVLGATAEDGLRLDRKPFTGHVGVTADHGPVAGSRVAYGGRRLVVPRREGLRAVRDFDAAAPARPAFKGIEVTPHDPRWVLRGRFRPYEADRGIRVENADGQERGLGPGGKVPF